MNGPRWTLWKVRIQTDVTQLWSSKLEQDGIWTNWQLRISNAVSCHLNKLATYDTILILQNICVTAQDGCIVENATTHLQPDQLWLMFNVPLAFFYHCLVNVHSAQVHKNISVNRILEVDVDWCSRALIACPMSDSMQKIYIDRGSSRCTYYGSDMVSPLYRHIFKHFT